MSNEPDYELRVIDNQVQEEYQRLSGKYDEVAIDKALMEIKNNPRAVSTLLHANYEGFRSLSLQNVRIVFVCCDECIGWGHVNEINCEDCESIHGQNQDDPQKVIKIFRFEDISVIDRAS